MIIPTRQFGSVDIEEEKIVSMPKGMPGFPGKEKFILLSHEEIDPILSFQSVDDPDLAFALMDPFLFMPDYAIDLDAAVRDMAWDVEKPEEIFLYSIINASSDRPEEITANLAGPLLVHTGINEAVQLVITDERYSHKHQIFAAEEAQAEG
ncbi:flagellar assembly protein FliW [Desulfoluna spongiiphila]|uniref:Flagellar assembly factor FliW n=1 Tax=Desulfoluna spongiiphila TaxID=419481 RepID=A0A1G5J457_9BACT|nr:flagellar assembly protein FliW [Desulfoluna spongiiphila]SCY82730.1 flagellar assembly factor FliW [Desulfoluna spongiiphila]VVS94453.1 flagellar assembly factor fliw [Desulfoluna spongiiphila]